MKATQRAPVKPLSPQTSAFSPLEAAVPQRPGPFKKVSRVKAHKLSESGEKGPPKAACQQSLIPRSVPKNNSRRDVLCSCHHCSQVGSRSRCSCSAWLRKYCTVRQMSTKIIDNSTTGVWAKPRSSVFCKTCSPTALRCRSSTAAAP